MNPLQAHVCERCGDVFFKNFKYLLSHIKLKHASEHNFQITCGIEQCRAYYNNVHSFRSHLYRKHRDVMIQVDNTQADNPPDTQGAPDEGQPMGQPVDCNYEDHLNREHNERSIIHQVASFLLKLKEKCHVPESELDEICSELSFLLSIQREIIIEGIQEQADLDVELLQTVTGNQENAIKEELSTPFRRNSYWRKHFNVILPKEVVFGRSETNQKKLCAHYVPLDQVLHAYLSHDDVFNEINKPMVANDNLTDLCDGSFMKSIYEEDTIYLQLYTDEYEVCNPLGAKRTLHKLLAFYFSVLNIPAQYRSKLDSIHLAMLAKHTLVQQIGLSKILQPLLDMLLQLEQQGIIIHGKHFKIVTLILSGDNLGIHTIAGLTQSFSQGRICRFCMATKERIAIDLLEEDYVQRTEEVYEAQVASVEADPSQASTYGVKCKCPFDNLKYFRTARSLPPDVMHDVFEGCLQTVLRPILKKLIDDKIVSLDIINLRIDNLDYHFADKGSKPMAYTRENIFSNTNYKGSASQKWCLMRLLPILIGDIVPPGNEYWELLLMFRTITDIILAPVIPKNQLPFLKQTVSDFLSMFIEKFPGISITPKLHYLIHYSRLILEFGPAVRVWSMRFEAQHAFFKDVARNLKCFKNISLSLAKRYQFLQALQFSSPVLLHLQPVSSGLSQIPTKNLPEAVLTFVAREFPPDLPESVTEANSVTLDCIEYKTGGVYCLSFDDDEMPSFISLKKVYWVQNMVHLFGDLFVANHFDKHFHCYFVNRTNDIVVKPEAVFDYHVLPMYTINGFSVVNMKYVVFSN